MFFRLVKVDCGSSGAAIDSCTDKVAVVTLTVAILVSSLSKLRCFFGVRKFCLPFKDSSGISIIVERNKADRYLLPNDGSRKHTEHAVSFLILIVRLRNKEI